MQLRERRELNLESAVGPMSRQKRRTNPLLHLPRRGGEMRRCLEPTGANSVSFHEGQIETKWGMAWKKSV